MKNVPLFRFPLGVLIWMFPFPVSGQLVDSPHPMLGQNPQHTGFSTHHVPIAEPAILWEAMPGLPLGHFATQVSLDEDGNIYAPYGRKADELPGEDNLISYDPYGTERWRVVRAGSRFGLSTPAMSRDGNLVLGCRDKSFRSFPQDGGTPLWSTPGGGQIISSAAINGLGEIYVGGRGDGGFFNLHPMTGRVLWEYRITEGVASSPALSHGESTVYFGRSGRSAGLYALNASYGALKWVFKLSSGGNFGFSSPAIGPDGTIYQSDARSGILYAIEDNGTSSTQKWSFDTGKSGDAPRLPAIGPDTVYVGTVGPDAILWALDFSGNVRWSRTFPGGTMVNSPTVTENVVYVTVDGDGGIYALTGGGGVTLWRKQITPPGGILSAGIVISEEGVLYMGTDGTLSHPKEAVIVALGTSGNPTQTPTRTPSKTPTPANTNPPRETPTISPSLIPTPAPPCSSVPENLFEFSLCWYRWIRRTNIRIDAPELQDYIEDELRSRRDW